MLQHLALAWCVAAEGGRELGGDQAGVLEAFHLGAGAAVGRLLLGLQLAILWPGGRGDRSGVSVQGGEPSPSRCSASQSPPYLDGVQRYRLRDIPDAGAVFDLLCGHVELMQRMATLQV